MHAAAACVRHGSCITGSGALAGMQHPCGDGDLSVLLTLKEAEASSLRQQVAQLAEELGQTGEVGCTRGSVKLLCARACMPGTPLEVEVPC